MPAGGCFTRRFGALADDPALHCGACRPLRLATAFACLRHSGSRPLFASGCESGSGAAITSTAVHEDAAAGRLAASFHVAGRCRTEPSLSRVSARRRALTRPVRARGGAGHNAGSRRSGVGGRRPVGGAASRAARRPGRRQRPATGGTHTIRRRRSARPARRPFLETPSMIFSIRAGGTPITGAAWGRV